MVIVKVMGGLGNQLFQYAFGKSIELQRAYEVKYDISYYENTPEGDTLRALYINRFIPADRIATKEEIKEIVGPDKYLINRVLKKCGMYVKRVRHEKADNIRSVEQVTDNSYLIGYWQSEAYFKNCMNVVKEWFDFSKFEKDLEIQSLLDEIDTLEKSVSIHVRAGDYLNEQNRAVFGDICTPAYYQNAYRYVKEQYPEAKFCLFTNDVEWTKENIALPYDEMLIVSEHLFGKEDWVELFLMSRCSINIIANSSYSWWAAWLNYNKDKMVISPVRWTNRSTDDKIISEDWIRIDPV